MTDLMTGLAAAAQALDIAKRLRDFEKSFDAAAFKMEIANLTIALSDAKMALADARDLMRAKDDEIAALKRVAASRMKTVSYRGYNFGIDANGESIGRPFCPICEKTKGIQVQISRGPARNDFCPSCKAVVGGDYPWRLPDGFDASGAA